MLRDMKERQVNIGDFTPMICNEIQQAIVDVLIAKTIRAAKEYGIKSIILGGGVAFQQRTPRPNEKAVARKLAKTTALYLPPTKLTTDNAAMIGWEMKPPDICRMAKRICETGKGDLPLIGNVSIKLNTFSAKIKAFMNEKLLKPYETQRNRDADLQALGRKRVF